MNITVTDAAFSYEGKRIFEDVSFTLSAGEILCLFGPNGCGKTTLLDTILGHLSLDKGKISADGEDICSLRPCDMARKIAYVPQVHEKAFPYRVSEIVLMGRTAYTGTFSSPGADDRTIAEKALEDLGIAHLRDRNYTQLSGGETQMVMLARALAQEAPVIIMDEPAAHLDFRHELALLEMIGTLVREKGLSVIISTHSPNHAFYFENAGLPITLALMHEKRFIATGRPSEVLTKKMMLEVFNIDSRVFISKAGRGQSQRYIMAVRTL